MYVLQQSIFIIRNRYTKLILSFVRKYWFEILGMKVGAGTILPKLHITWPHQIYIGKNCILEQDIYFKYDGIWSPGPSILIGDHVFIGSNCEFNINQKIIIENDTLIASGCRFIDHDHGVNLTNLMRKQPATKSPILIKNNVWIGFNVIVLKGVTIGSGAVVAAGAVVTKSVPSNEIWAGIPARKIGQRTQC